MKREFQNILDNYSRLVQNKDFEGFISLYATNLINFDLWQVAPYNTIESWQSNVKEWFDGLGDEYVKVSFSQMTSYDNINIAFIHGIITYQAHSKDGDKLRSMDNRLSWGLICIDNNWKIIHEHTSLPIDAESMNPVFNILP